MTGTIVVVVVIIIMVMLMMDFVVIGTLQLLLVFVFMIINTTMMRHGAVHPKLFVPPLSCVQSLDAMYYQPAAQRQSHQAIDVPSICFNATNQKEEATGRQLMVTGDGGVDSWRTICRC